MKHLKQSISENCNKDHGKREEKKVNDKKFSN